MSRGKLVFAGLLLVLALVSGTFFASWLIRLMLHVEVPLAWNTWWQYFHALDLPQVAPYATKIKVAVGIGFGVPMLAWLILLIPLSKPKPESLHGDAGYASLADLKKANMLARTPQSVLIGKYKGRYVWLNGARHLIVICPTRSGKTTSIAIPILLTYEQSMIVSDIKGELWQLTSGQRQAMGQIVYGWAPYDDEGRTHRFNPFTFLAGLGHGKRLAEIQTIAAILYPDEAGKDPFWSMQSRAAFTAFASFMFESWERLWRQGLPSDPNIVESFPSFERILRVSSGAQGRSTLDSLKEIVGNAQQYHFVSQQTRTIFSNLAGLAEQTFSSVIATMQAPLQQFLNPILAAATNATDFDILAIRRRPTTLYVNIPTNKLDESSKLMNIFYSSVIGNNLDKQLGEEPDLKYQMLMMMDEFTAMGRLDVWSKRISISASYGVRDCCLVQSRAQLRSVYGDDDAQNFITNHTVQVAFAPREQSDANEYSEMMGNKTIRKQNRSRTSGGPGGSQVSISYSEEKRPLMLPQEVKELPQDEELVFIEGTKPLRARKNWYFKDKKLKKLTELTPVVIEPLARRLAATKAQAAADEVKVIRPQSEQAAKWLQ